MATTRRLTFELHPRPPFRLDLTVWALRRRSRNRIDTWNGVYRRALLIDKQTVAVAIVQEGPPHLPTLIVTATAATEVTPPDFSAMRRTVELLLGVGVDLAPFYDLAEADPQLRVLRDRFRGVKPPRFPTIFEALANAVGNQQLSLDVGIELLNRLTATYGTHVRADHMDVAAFPEAAVLAGASVTDIRALGFSVSKAGYLVGLGEAVSSGRFSVAELESMNRDDATRCLERLHGVGRWSAEYVLLRGLGRLEVFPGDDVGARNKLQRMFGLHTPPSYAEILEILAPWHPFAGVVYFHLLLDGLAARGELEI
jgi:DNA-3-methyladenine glycosylase II